MIGTEKYEKTISLQEMPIVDLPSIRLFVKAPTTKKGELAELILISECRPVLGSGHLLVLRMKNFWKYSGRFIIWNRNIRATHFVAREKLSQWLDNPHISQGKKKFWEIGEGFLIFSNLIARLISQLRKRDIKCVDISPPIFYPALIRSEKISENAELRTIQNIFPKENIFSKSPDPGNWS